MSEKCKSGWAILGDDGQYRFFPKDSTHPKATRGGDCFSTAAYGDLLTSDNLVLMAAAGHEEGMDIAGLVTGARFEGMMGVFSDWVDGFLSKVDETSEPVN